MDNNTVEIGGRAFELKPLTFGKLKKVQPLLVALASVLVSGVPSAEMYDKITEALSIMIGGTEPPTPEWWDENLTMDQAKEVVERVFILSGVRTEPAGEAPTVP